MLLFVVFNVFVFYLCFVFVLFFFCCCFVLGGGGGKSRLHIIAFQHHVVFSLLAIIFTKKLLFSTLPSDGFPNIQRLFEHLSCALPSVHECFSHHEVVNLPHGETGKEKHEYSSILSTGIVPFSFD